MENSKMTEKFENRKKENYCRFREIWEDCIKKENELSVSIRDFGDNSPNLKITFRAMKSQLQCLRWEILEMGECQNNEDLYGTLQLQISGIWDRKYFFEDYRTKEYYAYKGKEKAFHYLMKNFSI